MEAFNEWLEWFKSHTHKYGISKPILKKSRKPTRRPINNIRKHD